MSALAKARGLIKSFFPKPRVQYAGRRICGIIDADTGVLLATSPTLSLVVALVEMVPDISYIGKDNMLPWGPHVTYTDWMWIRESRRFEPTHRSLVTPELVDKAALTRAKLQALGEIALDIKRERDRLAVPVKYQESVYWEKKAQAKAFKDSGHDAARIADFPYIAQYAEFAGISVHQASDDILFKAQLSDDILLRTELTRLTFFNRLKQAADMEQVALILRDFQHRA